MPACKTNVNDMNAQNLPARTISRHAFQAVTPKLSGSRKMIVQVLARYGAMTANQVVAKLPPSGLSNFNVRSRLAELVKMGVATVNGVVKDPVSGHMARQYRLLEPGEDPPVTETSGHRASRKQLEAELLRLREEVEALRLIVGGTNENGDDLG